ncbi:hypothetical protein CJ673_05875 [Aliarcobacter cryaerophilus]|uniref:Uncharacterized protein n=1 Tax=Aliarcobacter cryaerophilus TaxID=28198 RepID=A0A2S9T8B5_9BACT|nr:hypothetical protein [Aliarcobacter cryaerophilus]PRM95082.1 hypothetical protein CJ673_05875 [Aliarcobacter cryaerophilus]
MKLFTKLFNERNYDKIKHLDFDFKDFNERFTKHEKIKNFFVKTIGVFPNNEDSIGKSRIFSYAKSLKKEIEWAFLLLKLNRNKVNNFIALENNLYKEILFGNYDEALNILETIDKLISYSQWSIFMKMNILYLKKDFESLKKYTDYLLNKCDLESSLRNSIFLHNHKLLIDVNNESDFSKLILDIDFQLNDYESILINNVGKEKYYNDLEILIKYSEKYVVSPFNKKIENCDLQKLLSLSCRNSLIDLYKTFSIVITELQQQNALEIDNYLLDYIHKSFTSENFIKINSKNKINNNFSTFKLLRVNELYLKGEFNRVISISIKHLMKKPYSIDYIYLFINSIVYNQENPSKYLNNLNSESLLYHIIYNYYNILNNKSTNESLSKLKKILMIFGIQTQWSTYLYHLLFDFLCLNRDKNKKSFSKSLYFSNSLHPRYFYNLTKEQQISLVATLSDTRYKNSEILKIYKLELFGIDDNYNLNLSPKYRGDYILSTYEKSIDKIQLLYHIPDIPFNERIKIIIDYVNILFLDNQNSLALKLMVENMKEYKIPLCMFNYKKLILELNEELFGMIEYIYIIILDNSMDMIVIQYILYHYLNHTNKKYNLPSRLAIELDNKDSYLDLKLYILNFCTNNRLLEEFVLDITSSKELIEEQLKIFNVLFEKSTNILEKQYYQNNINELENKRISLNSTNYINKNKLRLNTKYIKIELHKIIKSLDKFPSLPNSQVDLQELIEKMVYKYIPKIETKEDLLLSDLSKTIDFVINSEYGLFNEIEADIKHGFMDQRLHEPFLKEKLVASFFQGNYNPINNWSQDPRLQNKLFEMTNELKLLIDNFKKVNIACTHEDNKNNILNFSQKEICKYIDINALAYNSDLYKEETTYINALINVVLEAIEKLLSTYRLKIKENLKELFNKNIIEKYISQIKDLEEDVIIQPVLDAFNNLEEQLNIAIDDVSSWFELYEETIHEHYKLNIILQSNEIKLLDLNININGPINSITFLGNTYQMIYRIFFNILQNVKKHALSNKVNIQFELTNKYLIFTFSNKNSNVNLNNLNLKSGDGESIIKNTVNKLNGMDNLKEPFVIIKKCDNNYSIQIKLSKEVLISE